MGDTAAGTSAAKSSKKRSGSEPDKVDAGLAKKILSQNQFHGLQDNDAGDILARARKNRKQKPLQLQTIEQKEKCPPIFVHGDPAALRPDLRQLITKGLKCTFRLCVLGVKLMTEGKQHYDVVKKYLEDKRFQYYTHDAPGTKPLKVLLRGLDDMKEEELMEELVSCALKPSGVFKIARQDKSRTYRDQLYLVHLEHGSIAMKDLKAITVINSTIVEWTRYTPKRRDVTQCMNCLRFGHGTRNCAMNARCNKCGEDHHIEQCERMEEADPKCANCGENHRATTKVCAKRTEYIEIRNTAATKNQPQRRTAPPPAFNDQNFPALSRPRREIPVLPPLQPQRRLAAAAASSQHPGAQAPSAPSTSQWSPPPGFRRDPIIGANIPPQEQELLYKSDQLLPIFEDMAVRMRSCKTKYDQIYTLGMLLIQYAY